MGILGDIAGMLSGNGDEAKAKAAWDALNAEAGPSAYSKLDPTGRNAQIGSLDALKSIAAGGMRPEDRAVQTEAMDVANRNEKGQRGAIVQNAAARGLSGSGTELASQLVAEQGGADRNAATGATMAGAASSRALKAIAEQGALGGQVRTGDAGVAGGLDAMDRFNAGQRVAKAQGQAGVYQGSSDRERKRWSNLGDSVENTAAAAYGAFGGGGGSGGLPTADLRDKTNGDWFD